MIRSSSPGIGRRSTFLIAVLVLSVLQTAFPAAGATYYVDANEGNDRNDGREASAPWQTLAKVNRRTFAPGDQIRFRTDRAWTGQLRPQGSGTAGTPIVLDTYGGGAPPKINGGGTAGAAVYLHNVQYWEVQNLDISNPAPTNSFDHIGIQVHNDRLATAHHIYLRNLIVHDVGGSNYNIGNIAGGIRVSCGDGLVNYNDVRVESNLVHDVSRVGITVNSATDIMSNTVVFGSNIWVRFNTIFNTGGDLMIIRLSSGPLIEHNVGHDFPTGGAIASFTDGMWCRSCVNAVFQYNEVYNSMTTTDGEAFDSDLYSTGTIFQYNYSHDNAGGFLLLIYNSTNNTVRYNVSRNDRLRIINFSGGICDNTKIYNNLFYIPVGINPNVLNWNSSDEPTKHTYFNNNIVYNLGQAGWDPLAGLSADYNCFYGNHADREPPDPHKITADPQLMNPGSGGIGIGTLTGYQLKPTSPCINAGFQVSDNGGLDFWGTSLGGGKPDVGAYQHPTRP